MFELNLSTLGIIISTYKLLYLYTKLKDLAASCHKEKNLAIRLSTTFSNRHAHQLMSPQSWNPPASSGRTARDRTV